MSYRKAYPFNLTKEEWIKELTTEMKKYKYGKQAMEEIIAIHSRAYDEANK